MTGAEQRRVVVIDRPDLRGAITVPSAVETVWVSEDEHAWDGVSTASMLIAHPAFGRDRTGSLIERMPDLEVVQTITAGVDWIAPVIPEGVVLCDGQGLHDIGVAEWTLAMLLSIVRDLPELVEWQLRGRWDGDSRFGGHGELHGSTVLLLGYGSIGRAVEARLDPFGVDVVRVARTAREDIHGVEALPDLLGQADAVVLLLPMTAETRGLVDGRFLAQMKAGSILINAARGAIVDTDALVEALDSGRLAAAGLDVTDPEPLPNDHPLWGTRGVFITPHVATRTVGLYPRVGTFVREQVDRFIRGDDLLNVVHGDY